MKFAAFAALNPGMTDDDLVADLEEICGLDGSEEYCEALDDYYSWGLSKENVLRPVAIKAKKTIVKAKKNKGASILIAFLIIAVIGAFLWWYFKIFKNK